ncbi:MerR family transcriptional regulator [Nocardia sp. NBC_00881]|uniref:MerR family transcriptional regulator n=1 Tax=Nocardia sp. NBC_00881 TaxID=2975995 RepID=UPI00386B0634|nr:MerR family transcriptional regulator [Nocardia sp. NBC_00881]
MDDTRFTIGAVAERTGLSVKTIRFYADKGIVLPTEYSPTGYRLYDVRALAQLDLVRTLRDLGLDLATVRRVLAHELSVAEVAAAHADALDTQIRILRLRRAVLRAVAGPGSTPEELDLMHKLVTLSAEERRRLIEDFVDATFGGVDANPEMAELIRSSLPELPDDPTPEQVAAWVQLAELTSDSDFRAASRRMAEYQARERADGDKTGLHHDLTEAVRGRVGAALDEGIAPDSPAATAVVTDLAAQYAATFAKSDDDALRGWMLERLEVANDPRVEHYWQLLAAVNGWPAPPSLAPVFAWFTAALRANRTSPAPG